MTDEAALDNLNVYIEEGGPRRDVGEAWLFRETLIHVRDRIAALTAADDGEVVNEEYVRDVLKWRQLDPPRERQYVAGDDAKRVTFVAVTGDLHVECAELGDWVRLEQWPTRGKLRMLLAALGVTSSQTPDS